MCGREGGSGWLGRYSEGLSLREYQNSKLGAAGRHRLYLDKGLNSLPRSSDPILRSASRLGEDDCYRTRGLPPVRVQAGQQ